jgi:hypothetical protein
MKNDATIEDRPLSDPSSIDHALRVAACTLCAEMHALIGDPHPWCPDA